MESAGAGLFWPPQGPLGTIWALVQGMDAFRHVALLP